MQSRQAFATRQSLAAMRVFAGPYIHASTSTFVSWTSPLSFLGNDALSRSTPRSVVRSTRTMVPSATPSIVVLPGPIVLRELCITVRLLRDPRYEFTYTARMLAEIEAAVRGHRKYTRSGRMKMKDSSNCVFRATSPETKLASMQMAVNSPVLMVYAMIVVRMESMLEDQSHYKSALQTRYPQHTL
jgi:hypothetical protein